MSKVEMPPLSPELQRIAGELIHASEECAVPGPVIDAFLPEALKVGPFTLDPINFAHILLLNAADSPFVTGREVTSQSLTLDVATAVHILANPWKQTRAEVERGEIGERIWETAAALPAMPPDEFQRVVEMIARHVNKGFSTALAMEKPGADDSGAQKKMQASDGGC